MQKKVLKRLKTPHIPIGTNEEYYPSLFLNEILGGPRTAEQLNSPEDSTTAQLHGELYPMGLNFTYLDVPSYAEQIFPFNS